ncbi:STAS domain-containing protein [Nonomuraea indica]|uniref:STAS domain-containing protein n=1 Tax=Nonomuraea indica TaxID=1581193 RepID=A0ABW8A834_9ACTN
MLDQAMTARPESGAGLRQVLYSDGLLRVVLDGPAGQPVVRLVGEVDTTNSRALVRALADAHRREPALVVDAARVSFIDVSGARALLGFVHEASVSVCRVSAPFRRLLTLLDLSL